MCVLQALLAWLGKPHLAHRVPPAAAATHWAKAPESLCAELANCDEIKQALRPSPCFTAQLLSVAPAAWSLPMQRGATSEVSANGECFNLPPLSESTCYRRHAAALFSQAAAA